MFSYCMSITAFNKRPLLQQSSKNLLLMTFCLALVNISVCAWFPTTDIKLNQLSQWWKMIIIIVDVRKFKLILRRKKWLLGYLVQSDDRFDRVLMNKKLRSGPISVKNATQRLWLYPRKQGTKYYKRCTLKKSIWPTHFNHNVPIIIV